MKLKKSTVRRGRLFFGKKHGSSRLGHFSSASARSHGHSKHASRHSVHQDHHQTSQHGFHHESKEHGHHGSKFVHHHKRDADAQFQNCFGSACNQNNFGKKKRDIVEAINSLTAEVLKTEDDVDDVVEAQKDKRDADPQTFITDGQTSAVCLGNSCLALG